MKKLLLLITVFILYANFALAEEPILSFEEQHADKSFIFLEYTRRITVNEDWSYRREIFSRAKILKEQARSLGEISVYYDKEKDKIKEISAYTITPDGKRHRYTKINERSPYSRYPIYSNSRIKMITMPEVNVGSIIERKTIIDSKGFPIQDSFWDEMYLKSRIPAKIYNISLTFPKRFNIQYKEYNVTHKLEIIEDDKNITYSWKLENVFDEREYEEYLPLIEPDEIEQGVQFSSIKSWSDISDWYYGLVNKNLNITPAIEQVTNKIISDKDNDKDKIRAILEYIQDNFRYVSMALGPHTLEPHPTDVTFNNKYGDCKDLSLLCMAMLKVAGIESNIVLFNDEFSITNPAYDLPVPALFQHVLVLVKDEEGQDLYIDPLLKGYDIGKYPFDYQNAYTFIITDDGGRFGNLPIFTEERDYSGKHINAVMYPDGSSEFETTAFWTLDASIGLREDMKRLSDSEKEKLFEDLNASLAQGGEFLEREWENFDSRYGRMKTYIKYRRPNAYPVDDGIIIIHVAGKKRDIHLTKETRNNDIFFPFNTIEEDITTYHIPKGFRVVSIPESYNNDIGLVQDIREYKRDKNTITIKEITRYSRMRIPKEEYPKIRDYFDRRPAGTQQRIILRQTKPWRQKLQEIWAIIRE